MSFIDTSRGSDGSFELPSRADHTRSCAVTQRCLQSTMHPSTSRKSGVSASYLSKMKSGGKTTHWAPMSKTSGRGDKTTHWNPATASGTYDVENQMPMGPPVIVMAPQQPKKRSACCCCCCIVFSLAALILAGLWICSVVLAKPPAPARRFMCPICKRTFCRERDLVNHKRTCKPRVEWFRCPVPACDKKFKTKSKLEWHDRTCHSFKCPLCSKNSKTKREYLEHQQHCWFKCPKCKATFRTQAECTKHKQSCWFACSGCKDMFATQSELTKHQQKCLKPPGFKCAVCGTVVDKKVRIGSIWKTCATKIRQHKQRCWIPCEAKSRRKCWEFFETRSKRTAHYETAHSAWWFKADR